jgi:hypothetical protein
VANFTISWLILPLTGWWLILPSAGYFYNKVILLKLFKNWVSVKSLLVNKIFNPQETLPPAKWQGSALTTLLLLFPSSAKLSLKYLVVSWWHALVFICLVLSEAEFACVQLNYSNKCSRRDAFSNRLDLYQLFLRFILNL